ncbi:methyltransferase type 11 [Nitrosopumilus sp. b3]|uniref:methyltransferase domain-containing protein n=1 Tax=Nitrosopumilus sp. b3 TaxID=2109909 RepID=UPI0015F7830A|nr:methyltransferase domain-containing protein [Nitrosopumilus sp. b3]KAF6246352.1 methyltransferase type 11 [Nitrosopumilus sp. b3]
MLESTLKFLSCVRCGYKLELDAFEIKKEVEEGILECKKCNLKFPIIGKIPILWDDFGNYLSSRKLLSGKLYQLSINKKMKSFLKKAMSKTVFTDDRTALENRWSKIYQNSRHSKFYSIIKNHLDSLPRSDFVLEHGCSIGITAFSLADTHKMVFGIDRSFSALQIAKKSYRDNLDYVVADSLSSVFAKSKFNLVIALNILELVEPVDFLKHVSKQMTSGYFVISDPYDFDRGINSVKTPLDESQLRTYLQKFGFQITSKTKNPSYIPWNLKLNSRATLNYKVDLIIGKK